jgi:hypothetical protein
MTKAGLLFLSGFLDTDNRLSRDSYFKLAKLMLV